MTTSSKIQCVSDMHPRTSLGAASSDGASIDGASFNGATEPPVPSPAPTDALLGIVVDDRYQISQRLARGGMASVYVAHDMRLDRPVALKVMHQHLAEDPLFLQRFSREARSAARITHPGVVSVSDQGSVDNRPYLVMELIEGPTIRELLRQEGSFTLAQSLDYCENILHALRAAHRIGVIHRDIKPENVLVPAEGPARVTDFGLARAVSEATMSVTGNMLGTVTYMAPEVATKGSTDERTDLYSVGIMLYEMLTGVVPWHGDNALHIAYSHVHDDVPAPSDEEPWIPREIDDFVAALCARDPAERLSSADDALDMLGRVNDSIPAELRHQRAAVTATALRPQDSDHTAVLSPPTQTALLPAISAPSASPSPAAPSLKPLTQAPTNAERPSETPSTALSVTDSSTSADGAPTVAVKKRRTRLILVIALIFSLISAGGGWWWWSEYGPGSYLALPVTDGRAATDVRTDLEALGVQIKEEEAFSDDVVPGVVISSLPASASSVHKYATVTLVISKGPDLRLVPNVVNKPLEEARAALEEAGLTVGEQQEDWSEEVPAQAVISQSEAPETKLKVGSAVNLVLSKGREPRATPDLANRTLDEAKAALDELALTVEVREAHSDSVEKGRVISQEPAAQTQLYRGDTVIVTISLGPEMVQVPNVSGKSESEAVQILKDAGFAVDVRRQLGGVFRTAHSTDPASGASVPKGSTIVLIVF